jgi:hypothetical protein
MHVKIAIRRNTTLLRTKLGLDRDRRVLIVCLSVFECGRASVHHRVSDEAMPAVEQCEISGTNLKPISMISGLSEGKAR